ncbi:class I SAM-dependent methyltransferase [Mycobacterium sp. IS-1264]|uniref:class I SAM-dependent methyltransferase n=1 Tax=Mycobacterium sp. IS-1264 TaxID=1834158 RepID=UPI0009FABA9A|nr:class I SAM-dependent methyltransferase [Mycobacterium sp. IS-1264]
MASKQTLFRIFYRIGFTPWDGHAIAQSLRDLIEGSHDNPALAAGSALDVGCGTGDSSIYLAQHGWNVTGVDFVAKALEKARAKSRTAGVPVKFVEADVTHLSQAGIDAKFDLIVDNGCLHGMSDEDRNLYVKEITAAAAPGARLVIVAAPPGGPIRLLGLDGSEVERRFTPGWTLLSSAGEKMVFANDAGYRHTPVAFIRNRFAVRCYLLQLTG